MVKISSRIFVPTQSHNKSYMSYFVRFAIGPNNEKGQLELYQC